MQFKLEENGNSGRKIYEFYTVKQNKTIMNVIICLNNIN